MDRPETDEPAGMTLTTLVLLRGIPDDAWTEGTIDEVALRLHRLRVFIEFLGERAAWCEQQLVDAMPEDTMTVQFVGPVHRVERSGSAWKTKTSGEQMRSDLKRAVADSIAVDVATGDMDPMKRNVARATMDLAFEVIPSFSSLGKAGRERLGLHITDYRDFSTSYKIAIDADKDADG